MVEVKTNPDGTLARRAEDASTVIETPPGQKDEDLVGMKLAALQVAKVVGIHENSCPADCNGRGSCFDSGCRCTSGFTGDSCQINVRDILARHRKTEPKRRSVGVINM
jgi:hypothetical protein